MGLWDKLKGELVDVIQWTDDSRDTMVWRFPRYNNEIKYGAKLVCREGQAAVFINEGKLADVFQPGTHTLSTQNLPILATLKGWKYGFQSPFKAEVYFVNTRRFSDLKWGTKNPIMLRDAEFGPIRLRAFGTYEIKVTDPAVFIREVVGTDGRLTTDEIKEQLRNMIITRFTDLLGESRIPALDLASKYNELSEFVTGKLNPEYAGYGLEISKFLVENISLPEEVEKALDKRSSMGVLGNMQAFTQFQVANSIPDAAKNPGGLAAAGVGVGLGVGMAGQVMQGMQAAAAPPPAPMAPPPLPTAVTFFVALNGTQAGPYDLNALQSYISAGQISRDTLAWRQGMAAWTPASQVPELQALFNSPPPLPPPPPPLPRA